MPAPLWPVYRRMRRAGSGRKHGWNWRKRRRNCRPREALRATLAADSGDLEARYSLAVVEAAAGNAEAALEHAMSLLQADRSFRDDIGRKTMLRIFTVLGKGSALANQFRRRMFNFLH